MTAFPMAASDKRHVAEISRELTAAGRAGRLAARVRSAARRPVLSGVSSVGDVALAAAVTIAAIVTAIEGYLYVSESPRIVRSGVAYITGPPSPHPHLLAIPSWTLFGLLLTTAPLAFRRTYPASAFGVILAAFIATRANSTAITVGAVIFAAYCAAVYSKYRRMMLLGLLAGAIIVTVAYPEATAPVPPRLAPLLVLLPTVALGYMIRMWRQSARDSAERLRLAQAVHEAETRRAVETERARIASELHDVVTHNVSVMVVQAGAARRVLDISPGSAREALLAVEAGGRTALTELRHLLGLLAPSGEPDAVSADDGALRPQPGMANLAALVDRVRAAGPPVELSVAGSPRELSRGLDLAAYRVVQEALTNVIKHAGLARTAVHIEYRAHDLLVDVANEAPAAAGPVCVAVAAAGSSGCGSGSRSTAARSTPGRGPAAGGGCVPRFRWTRRAPRRTCPLRPGSG
jgi:signal transduction histidine kinase